jgi:hypothetical protein
MTLLPATVAGRWSLLLLGGSLLALAIMILMVNMGVRGGQTWLDQPIESWLLLTTPMLLCAGLAVAGGIAGLVALVRERAHALLALLPIAWALVVVAFIAGEFANPH